MSTVEKVTDLLIFRFHRVESATDPTVLVLIKQHTSHNSSVSFAKNEDRRERLEPAHYKTQRLSRLPHICSQTKFLTSDWGAVFNFYIVLPPAFLTSNMDSAGLFLLTYAEYWRLQFYRTRYSCGRKKKNFSYYGCMITAYITVPKLIQHHFNWDVCSQWSHNCTG